MRDCSTPFSRMRQFCGEMLHSIATIASFIIAGGQSAMFFLCMGMSAKQGRRYPHLNHHVPVGLSPPVVLITISVHHFVMCVSFCMWNIEHAGEGA